MFNFIYALKGEFILYYQHKKNYIYQSISYYLQRIIFLVGMISVAIVSNKQFDLTILFKIIFWFAFINNLYEVSKRIESEYRLHQQMHCFALKTSYWQQLFIRTLPILFESLVLCFISFLFIKDTIYVTQINFISLCIYLVIAVIQFIIFHYLFVFMALYFTRVQAVLGFIESFTFFYTGMVIIPNHYQFFIFKWMDQILNNNCQSLLMFLILIMLEIISITIGITYFNQVVKKKGL